MNELKVDFPHKFSKMNQFIKGCETCSSPMHQRGKNPKNSTEFIIKDIDEGLSAYIFKFGTNIAIVIVVELFSKYTRCRIPENESSKEVCHDLLNLVSEWGPTISLKTDNESNFISAENKELNDMLNIYHTTSSPKNSRENSDAEPQIEKI